MWTRITAMKLPKAAVLSAAIFGGCTLYNNNRPITLDTKISLPDDPVKPPTSVPDFQRSIVVCGKIFDLFAIGVRTVSIFNMHVYGLGLYASRDHLPVLKAILNGAAEKYNATTPAELEAALRDKSKGKEIISEFFGYPRPDSQIPLVLRIVTARNTDFGHLRDGFVRAVLAHPYAKSLLEMENERGEAFAHGIEDLRKAFGRKVSVPKHKELLLYRRSNGELDIFAEIGDTREQIGTVHNSEVSQFLFQQYMNPEKPSSPTAYNDMCRNFAQMIAK
ncbi:hypothetical protein CANCADRAFT_95547 [Tortispora caseinolytica NRRL Y-17796]|uniref:Altered inheritance of mitochondria protein 18, mitochondrial n=1 Tax=Tortispora caseinolytica NRRL Y-17796 TaxID=767744 RepID=A0A1E4TMI0_9ASCO|nr:hypothetical protein CANCADRAFT_95547 [Tortispora caseinolytica NRRL Y-17796]